MLVLSRRPNERVLIPGLGVSVTLVQVTGNQVRLGFEAPKDAQVIREELLEKMWNGESLLAADQPLGHELRNKLSSIGLLAKMADQQVGKGDAAGAVKTIKTIQAEIKKLATEGPPKPVKPFGQARPKTLVVEDDEAGREGLMAILRTTNIPVDSTTTAEDAIVMLGLNKYDAVLLDLSLAGKQDGWSVAAHVAKLPAPKPDVYILSARQPRPMQPYKDWFRKPYDPEALLSQLTTAGVK